MKLIFDTEDWRKANKIAGLLESGYPTYTFSTDQFRDSFLIYCTSDSVSMEMQLSMTSFSRGASAGMDATYCGGA